VPIVYNDPPDNEGFGPVARHPRLMPDTPRPAGASYPLAPPDLRQRNPEAEKLAADIIRAFGRRRFPPIVSERDKTRLAVMLYRFLYSPEWPDLREGDGDE
jgi:hypothetical protein